MPAGHEVHRAQGLSLAQAKQWAAEHADSHGCRGFTFDMGAGAGAGAGGGRVCESTVLEAVYFKASGEWVPAEGSGWHTYLLKHEPASTPVVATAKATANASPAGGGSPPPNHGSRRSKKCHWKPAPEGMGGAQMWPQAETDTDYRAIVAAIMSTPEQLRELRSLFAQGRLVANAAVVRENDGHTGRRKIKHFTNASFMGGYEPKSERAKRELVTRAAAARPPHRS